MPTTTQLPRIYDGDGDLLMSRDRRDPGERIMIVPDALPGKTPHDRPHIRILWGQHLLEDLLLGRYRSLVCAVNTRDNSHGIIGQLATLLPTTQWDERSVTAYAAQFAGASSTSSDENGQQRVKVIKYDMDMVEVLAILRPPRAPHLTLDHLSSAFRIIAQMIAHRTTRLPTASVSFLGARANALLDQQGANKQEPSFEAVLRTMYEAGYHGDVYPSPAMWAMPLVGLYPRYPFPDVLDRMRDGGF
jgi:hypothetical protein